MGKKQRKRRGDFGRKETGLIVDKSKAKESIDQPIRPFPRGSRMNEKFEKTIPYYERKPKFKTLTEKEKQKWGKN